MADCNCFQLSETVPIEYWFAVVASAVTKFNLKQILNSHINKLCHHQTSTLDTSSMKFQDLILSSIALVDSDKMSHCNCSWMGVRFRRWILVVVVDVTAVSVSSTGHVIVLI